LADVATTTGAPSVVELPLVQLATPPSASAVDDRGREVPPVAPPVQPETIDVPETVPLNEVQVMLTAAPASPASATLHLRQR